MRLRFRLACLRIALSGKIPERMADIKNIRRVYLRAALLGWTVYDNPEKQYGLTHIILFPAGRNERKVHYYDQISTKMTLVKNPLVAYGRLELA